MKNLITWYALLRSPIFWVFVVLVAIGMYLPESVQEGWAELTVLIIGTMIGSLICNLLGIPLGYLALLVAVIVFVVHPILALVIGLLAIGLIIKSFKSNDNDIDNFRDRHARRHNDTNVVQASSTPKSSVPKNAFFDQVTIDEEIDTAQFIKIRDAINSMKMEYITEGNLHLKLCEIEDKADMRIFREPDTTLDSLKELKRLLNSKDLDNRKTITLRELFEITDKDAEEYEQTYMSDNEDITLSKTDELAIGYAGYKIASELDKRNRVDKLRKEVQELDKEYRFERGFDPDWDEEEHLSSRYNNEEDYLNARKEELKQKNISYDSYLSPEEREDEF